MEYRVFKDGNAWCAVDQNFINLQESDAEFDLDPLIALAKKMSPKNVRPAFVVFTNTDLTEGRGRQYPLSVCDLEATAERVAKGKYIMGTDAPVEERPLVMVCNSWYGPIHAHAPSELDETKQQLLDKKREAEKKAIACGLTPSDLADLRVSV